MAAIDLPIQLNRPTWEEWTHLQVSHVIYQAPAYLLEVIFWSIITEWINVKSHFGGNNCDFCDFKKNKTKQITRKVTFLSVVNFFVSLLFHSVHNRDSCTSVFLRDVDILLFHSYQRIMEIRKSRENTFFLSKLPPEMDVFIVAEKINNSHLRRFICIYLIV